MENKDARRNRVPAGTFGRSDPPSKPDEHAGEAPAETPRERRRFTSTLTGEEQVMLPEAAQEEAARRQVSTLVGHPGGPAVAPQPVAPVLSPPKWRGASAYVEGEEPQPRVSSIPTPPPATAAARQETAAAFVRSRVTTKIGHPGPTQPEAAAPDSTAIGDAIQEMLDSQVSVPMHADDAGLEADDDLPLEELSPDELIDAGNEPDPIAAVPAPTAIKPVALQPDDLPIEVEPAVVAPISAVANAPAKAAATLARIELKSTARPPVREELELPPVRRQAVPAAPAARAPAPAAPTAQPAKFNPTLSPLELSRARRSDETVGGVGSILIAAMLVFGFMGWWFTRGDYPGPAHRAFTTPEPAAPIPPPAAVAQAAPKSATPSSTRALAVPPTASVAPAQPAARATKLGPKRGRAESESKAASASAATRSASSQESMHVPPREVAAQAGDVPETPTRENIRASLEAIRVAVSACAHGQHGVAQLDITVANSGFVTYAVVGGDFAGTPEGSCIARAARSAQFEPFKKPRFRVIYPFSL